LRGRSFQAVFILGVLMIGAAYLSGHFSPRHPKTVALDVGFRRSGSRWFCSTSSGFRNWSHARSIGG
jgi:hypothetical protein